MKKLYTNKTLFYTIVEILKEKGMFLDILDYHLPASKEAEIKDYEWDCTADLKFGGSEGIYLDIYAEGNMGIGEPKVRLGTFKTLREDREAFHQMAKLQADFLWEARDFVNHNIDDFTWCGYDVEFYHGDKRTMGYTTKSMESVNNLIKRNRKFTWDYVVVTNNATCKEKHIRREEIDFD